jgi:hypothetical protein
VAGITVISSILFVSASIPCIMATNIPISFYGLTVVWGLRTALTIVIAIPLSMVVEAFIMYRSDYGCYGKIPIIAQLGSH